MSIIIFVATTACLLGGERIDVSKYLPITAGAIELKVSVHSAAGALLIYSPGYEDQQLRFDGRRSFGAIPIASPVLCVKPIGGPFKFKPLQANEWVILDHF
jgi:hypothetical protein